MEKGLVQGSPTAASPMDERLVNVKEEQVAHTLFFSAFFLFPPSLRPVRNPVEDFSSLAKIVIFRGGAPLLVRQKRLQDSVDLRKESAMRKRIFAFLLFVAMTVTVTCTVTGEMALAKESAQDISKKVLDTYKSMKSAMVSFSIASPSSTMKGTVTADGVKIRYDEEVSGAPAGRPIPRMRVTDGSVIWTYSPTEKAALKQSFTREMMEQTLQGRKLYGCLASLLPIAAISNCAILEESPEGLTLKTPPGSPTSFTFWIDRKSFLISKIQVKDQSGASTMTYKEYRINLPVPEKTFTFLPPKGVKIITQ